MTAAVRAAAGWRPSVSRTISVDAGVAWRLLTVAACWPRWGPSVTAVDPPSFVVRPGARGRVRTRLGLWVPFTITSVTGGREWRWRVLGVPATGHRVTALPDGRSRVSFDVPLWQAPYLLVCLIALRRIDALARREPPGASPA